MAPKKGKKVNGHMAGMQAIFSEKDLEDADQIPGKSFGIFCKEDSDPEHWNTVKWFAIVDDTGTKRSDVELVYCKDCKAYHVKDGDCMHPCKPFRELAKDIYRSFFKQADLDAGYVVHLPNGSALVSPRAGDTEGDIRARAEIGDLDAGAGQGDDASFYDDVADAEICSVKNYSEVGEKRTREMFQTLSHPYEMTLTLLNLDVEVRECTDETTKEKLSFEKERFEKMFKNYILNNLSNETFRTDCKIVCDEITEDDIKDWRSGGVSWVKRARNI